ncbi:hypothetical protein R6Q57_027403 [Mikania cordata]
MDSQSNSPHVLIFPFPVQGHVSCMLKLAELLCLSGVNVTFLNSDIIHRRLLRYTDVISRFSRYSGFRFETISDGLPPDHPRSGDRVVDIFDSIKTVTKPMLREMLLPGGCLNCGSRPPISSVIADGIMCFTIDVAKVEMGIPVFLFRTVSASCFWAFYCIPNLIESGDLPIKEDDEMDRLVNGVTGMEKYLRLRDLPSFCRASDLSDQAFQVVTSETQETHRANGLILNTFEDLEESALIQIRKHIPNLYAIGPLHAHLKSRLEARMASPLRSSNSLWEEDRTCMTWISYDNCLSLIAFVRGLSARVVSASCVLLKSGSILFSSFTAVSPSNFYNVIEAFGFPKMLHVGGRDRASPTQLTGAYEEIPLHHEMAYLMRNVVITVDMKTVPPKI